MTVPVETLMRVTSNPFFSYLAERLTAWTDPERRSKDSSPDARSWNRLATAVAGILRAAEGGAS